MDSSGAAVKVRLTIAANMQRRPIDFNLYAAKPIDLPEMQLATVSDSGSGSLPAREHMKYNGLKHRF
jgi:hypothetical protein